MKVNIFEEEFQESIKLNQLYTPSPVCSSIEIIRKRVQLSLTPSLIMCLSQKFDKLNYNRNQFDSKYEVEFIIQKNLPGKINSWIFKVIFNFKTWYENRFIGILNTNTKENWLLFLLYYEVLKKIQHIIAVDESGLIAGLFVSYFKNLTEDNFWSLETGLTIGNSSLWTDFYEMLFVYVPFEYSGYARRIRLCLKKN